MLSTKFDDQLKQIEWFRIHETLLPFVGSNYEECRILHIGESHFLSHNYGNEDYGITYFIENWWKEACTEVLKSSTSSVNTRQVVEDKYLQDKSGPYEIFTNVVKAYSKIALGKEITHINKESKQIYNDFAFMNFFQMPSLYSGMKYWNSIYKSAKRCGNKKLASELWSKCVEVSAETVDAVVEILEPKIILFTSLSAWNAYYDYKYGKGTDISSDPRYIRTSHPSAPISWNKPLKSLDGKTGKETLEEALRRIYEV